MIVAIDPGSNGGIAFYDGHSHWAHDLGTPMDVVEALEPFKGTNCTVYLEDLVKFAGPRPGARIAVYAASWGTIQGIVLAMRLKLVLVSPTKWQTALGCGAKRNYSSDSKWKAHLKDMAQRTFPDVPKITLAMADALLILDYAKRVA